MIEVTPDSIECCCPCHSLSRKALSRLRDSRARLQAECEMLHRRREVMLHQLTQIHQRSNLIYTPVVCIYRAPDQRMLRAVENHFDFGVTARRIHWRAIMDGGNDDDRHFPHSVRKLNCCGAFFLQQTYPYRLLIDSCRFRYFCQELVVPRTDPLIPLFFPSSNRLRGICRGL